MFSTYQPKKSHSKKEHGFSKSMSTSSGSKILSGSSSVGRKILSYWFVVIFVSFCFMAESCFSVLRDDRSFSSVYSSGRSFVGSCVILYIYSNFGKGVRLGITASKKVGNAVERNSASSVLKVAFLELISKEKFKDVDLVLVARGKTPFVKSFVVKKCLAGLFYNAGSRFYSWIFVSFYLGEYSE